jgi:hypothetical protein
MITHKMKEKQITITITEDEHRIELQEINVIEAMAWLRFYEKLMFIKQVENLKTTKIK